MQQLSSLLTKEAVVVIPLRGCITNYHVQLNIPNEGSRCTNKERVSKRYALHIWWNASALCFHLDHRSLCRSGFLNVGSDFKKAATAFRMSRRFAKLTFTITRNSLLLRTAAALIMWWDNTNSLRVLAISSLMAPIQHGVLSVKTLDHVLLRSHSEQQQQHRLAHGCFLRRRRLSCATKQCG